MTTKSFKLAENTSSIAPQRGNNCAWLLIYVAVIGIVVASVVLAVLLLAQKFDQETNAIPAGPTTTVAPLTATEIVIVQATPRSPTVTARPSLAPSAAVANADGLTPTFTFAPPTRLPDTATPRPTRTHTPTLTSTPTLTPSQTLTPSLTLTASLTPTHSVTPSDTATPTATYTPSTTPTSPYTAIPYPNGRRVAVYFDGNSFYIWNPGPSSIRVASVSLRGIDATGQPTAKSLSGEIWAQFYAEIESGKCVAIEITQSASWLQPSVCRDYNAIITPQRSSQNVFWLDDGQTVAFEALWSGQPVGQCSIQTSPCDLYLP